MNQESILTQYGLLKGIVAAEFYPNGKLCECTLNCCNRLVTPYGPLIPQYADDGARRKYTKSLSFHPNGDLKSISLHEQTMISSPVGSLPAELVTFYPGERICRLFPLNGKLTGFWSEANEYALAQELQFTLPVAELKQKIIGIHFYENGAVQSMTFWPKDSPTIRTPLGNVPIRIGFSLYPDGRLQSFEPLNPLPVDTPIGKIIAYDLNANGISGDSNSLCFTLEGAIRSLITSSDRIMITDRNGHQIAYEPGLALNVCNDQKMEPVPLAVEFSATGIRFPKQKGKPEYQRQEFTFAIQSRTFAVERLAEQCSGYEN